ncbi:phage head morphogenesis protein [Bacillus idriensis]|uniref:Phage head morphogenesis protein n=1 Tax=Metabacillus idriensis TaxID=324768 RepID=A0A6I2MBW1_9BACI|nr:phage minor head protein [Metabacillus idriensis]MRX54834.1 phage head morphogenesis protein [Metabacillus idriensis]
MNQLEIEEILDKLLAAAELSLQVVFAKRLKTILRQVAQMYRKYEKNGELSFTELNKYNRFQKEMKLIGEMFTEDYKQIIQDIQGQVENQFVGKYLMTAYITEMSVNDGTDMGFDIPSKGVIKEALLNPIAELTLPKVLELHRNEIVRKIDIELAQGMIAGEGYATMAKRIEMAVGFSQKKARLVARTEVGRARSIAAEKVMEKASEYAEMGAIWMSMLDHRVRESHQELDGKKTDKKGYFHYKAWKAKAPRLWGIASMDIQCRCVKLLLVNGLIPEYRRERDYMDDKYQQKLADRIDKYMADNGLTYKQALKRAQKEVQAPSRVIPYVSYDDWYKSKEAVLK